MRNRLSVICFVITYCFETCSNAGVIENGVLSSFQGRSSINTLFSMDLYPLDDRLCGPCASVSHMSQAPRYFKSSNLPKCRLYRIWFFFLFSFFFFYRSVLSVVSNTSISVTVDLMEPLNMDHQCGRIS